MEYNRKSVNFIGFELVDEKWVTLNYNGELVPRYLISDYGRILDTMYDEYLNYILDKDGYFRATINFFGESKIISVHRFELMSFDFRPNFKDLVVNHKDGIKTNLALDNLEWSTPLKNTQHGWINGLNPNVGTHNGNGKYGDDIIHGICKLIDLGASNSDICNILGIYDKPERLRYLAMARGIRNGLYHRNISINYEFGKCFDLYNNYEPEIAEKIYELLLEPNNTYTYTDIMNILDIPSEKYDTFKVYVNDVIAGRTSKHLLQKYGRLKRPLE